MLCEVETDKATIGWEAQEEGFIAAILLQDGSKDIAVGTPAAVIVEEEVRGKQCCLTHSLIFIQIFLS